MDKNIRIRDFQREDCPEIFRLIQGLADHENVTEPLRLDAKKLEEDGFDADPPLFGCLVIDDPEQNENDRPKKLIGYALYHSGYSSHDGKKYYLEDIMVEEKYRGRGIGKALFQKLCQVAVRDKCEVLNFTVVTSNPAAKFYKKFGAENFTLSKDWNFFHLKTEDLYKAAAQSAEI